MLAASGTILAQDASQTFFTNVHVFDGHTDDELTLVGGQSVA
ncbi:hypothetical protein [Thiocapsa bogorovii]|nr:hypothetical protein [Thiocapsa bogorovii]